MSTPVTVWRYVFRCKADWAVVVMDSTGIFLSVSSWGAFGHYWSHHGHDDFRKFFLGKDFARWPDYCAGKFRPERVYDEEKTFQGIRERILRLRREGSLSKEAARKEWDHFVEVVCGQWCMNWKDVTSISEEDFRTWYDGTSLSDAAECAHYGEDPQAVGFVQNILPLLAEAIQAELAAERGAARSAAPGDNDEDLADALDQESRAHAQTRQSLVGAARELESLRQVERAARAVLRVTDTPTTFEQEEARQQEMYGALADLREALGPVSAPPPDTAMADRRNDCTCTGHCRGAEGLGEGWRCVMQAHKEVRHA